jgi:hypothetical protein
MRIAWILSILTISSITLLAQNPVEIDVTAITVNRQSLNASLTMTATGLPAPFQSPMSGSGEVLMWPLEGLTAGRLGESYPTSFGWESNGRNFVSGFYPNGSNGNTRVNFFLTGTSDDIVLSPRVPRKKKPAVFISPARIVGKIEILVQGRIVAVDHDVNLSGTVTTELWNYLAWSYLTSTYRRGFDFKSITFSYAQ